jgi:glycosyltransferase involved in cell wall biosynthesis
VSDSFLYIRTRHTPVPWKSIRRLKRREDRSEACLEHIDGVADVVMILENCGYPLDARVRMEAESLVDSGFSVTVVAPRERGQPVRDVIGGVRVRRFRMKDGNGRLFGTAVEYASAFCAITAIVLARLIRSAKGTLHVHNPPDLFFPLLWLARLRGWATVYDHHDDSAGLLHAKFGSRSVAVLDSLLTHMRRWSAHAADLTISTNETQRQLVEADARRVIVVRNSPPVWFADYRPSPPRGRSRLVFLGEIGGQDRVERAIEVLCAVVARQLDVEMLIVGDGPERGTVERRARELRLSDRVTITGWVPFEEVPVLLASAHVGIDTSPPIAVNHGSTMVKVMEYLAVGLPVVATALHETKITGGGVVTLIDEDSAAAFVEPIIRLLTSAEAWHAAADQAKARGMQLQWPAQAQCLVDAYRTLGNSSGSQ